MKRIPRSSVLAWILLDWAASGFSTISITLLVAYFDRIAFVDGRWGIPGGVLWAWTLASAMLCSAFLSPLLSAWVDRRNFHQRAVVATSCVGAAASISLAIIPPTSQLGIIAAIIVATVAFDMAAIFTASLLPRLAQGHAADTLSSSGFAAGYAGGAIALILATSLVAARDTFGLSATGALQGSFAIMGVWWLLFSLPTAFFRMGEQSDNTHAGTSTAELLTFLRTIFPIGKTTKNIPQLGWLMLGVVTILGVVQTAIPQFSNVALETFHLEPPQLVQLVLLVQLVALPGAIVIGWLSGLWSRHGAANVCLAGWALVLGLAWGIQSVPQLYALAVLLALVLGGIQSVLRAMLAVAAPPGHHAATFGIMQVGTKLTGFVASLIFGWAYMASGIPRAGLVILLVQLILGWWLLSRARPKAQNT